MRKLIEMSQEYLIVCDNPECNFKVANDTKDPNVNIEACLNKACPECGDNLLTEGDYKRYLKLIKLVNWINRWLSWLTLFSPRKRKRKSIRVHTHKEIKIEDK